MIIKFVVFTWFIIGFTYYYNISLEYFHSPISFREFSTYKLVLLFDFDVSLVRVMSF